LDRRSGTISLQQFVDGMERWRKMELDWRKAPTAKRTKLPKG
jgi:hypothetical protein